MYAASRNTSFSKRTTLANQLADLAIEQSRNTAFDNLQLANVGLAEACTTSGFVATCTSTVNPGNPYTRVRTISPRDSAGTLVALASSNQADIDVTVTFTDARGDRPDDPGLERGLDATDFSQRHPERGRNDDEHQPSGHRSGLSRLRSRGGYSLVEMMVAIGVARPSSAWRSSPSSTPIARAARARRSTTTCRPAAISRWTR